MGGDQSSSCGPISAYATAHATKIKIIEKVHRLGLAAAAGAKLMEFMFKIKKLNFSKRLSKN